MKTKFLLMLLLTLISDDIFSQNITNTLPSTGKFYIRTSTDTMVRVLTNGNVGLGLNPTAQLELSRNIRLKTTTDTSRGIIFKGIDRFMHDYSPSNPLGQNTFAGILSGSFSINGLSIGEGSQNTGFGFKSLSKLTSGFQNTSIGTSALQNLTDGEMNTAVGMNSQLMNQTGARNTSVGTASMYDVTSGSENSAFGYGALGFITTGFNNTAIGHNSGSNLLTGGNNTLIGNNAQPTSNSVSNQITLGNNNVNSLRCNVQSITSLSDMRDKKEIEDLTLGLDFISKLKPRQFKWDKREWYKNNVSDGSKMEETFNAGFIAQELDESQINEQAEWLGLVNKDNPEKIEATYGNLLPVIVKAIQELKDQNEQLNKKISELNAVITALSKQNSSTNIQQVSK